MKKLALVTGGAHPIGIGFSSAKALVALGYDVIVTGVDAAEIALTPATPGITTRVLDVTNADSVAALVGDLSRLDALVNCAGSGSMNEFELPEFARIIEINLVGAMRMITACHPLLKKQGGAIVNFGSMYSIFGSNIAPGYTASKGGIAALTRSIAAVYAKDGIRCNAVAPGWIKTNLARGLWENEEVAQPIVDRTPMGRFGAPEEIGDVVGFLCSHEARFVTGVLLPVDGGYSISG